MRSSEAACRRRETPEDVWCVAETYRSVYRSRMRRDGGALDKRLNKTRANDIQKHSRDIRSRTAREKFASRLDNWRRWVKTNDIVFSATSSPGPNEFNDFSSFAIRIFHAIYFLLKIINGRIARGPECRLSFLKSERNSIRNGGVQNIFRKHFA